ncbi:MAG: hypothetical protein AABY46_04490 [Nitrospirota bacterium]
MAGQIQTIRGVPGGIMVDGEAKVLTEVYDGYKWDTVAVHNSGAAVASGQQFYYFRDLTDKNLIDCNITQQRRISRGEEMEVKTIGAHVSCRQPDGAQQATLDIMWAVERLYLELKVNKKPVSEGPIAVYQSGLGVTGYSSRTTTDVLTNGVASQAAVRPLYKNIDLTSEHDIEGQMTHFSAAWLTTYTAPTIAAADAILLRLFLGGRIKVGITRG